jgi:hypothetical protein
MKSRSQQILGWFLQPRSIVFGIGVAHFMWMWIRDSGVSWDLIDYHGYYADTHEAFILLIAAVLLLHNRIWSCAIAAVLCARTVYVHVFLALVGISNAHEISMFSIDAWTRWLLVFRFQPQYVLHLTLAVFIFVFSAFAMVKSARRWSGYGAEQIVGPERG